MSLRLLQISELTSLIKDNKLDLPGMQKLKHKDGVSYILDLQNNINHPTDLIAAIVKAPQFPEVTKSAIKEIIEKVCLIYPSFPALTSSPVQAKERKAIWCVAIAYAPLHAHYGVFFFNYISKFPTYVHN